MWINPVTHWAQLGLNMWLKKDGPTLTGIDECECHVWHVHGQKQHADTTEPAITGTRNNRSVLIIKISKPVVYIPLIFSCDYYCSHYFLILFLILTSF